MLPSELQQTRATGWIQGAVFIVAALLLILHSTGPQRATAQEHRPEVQEEQRGAVRPPSAGKKLVLTDGTFQLVREYERRGDRVRYYSLERSKWEELPVALVDWEATRQAELEAERRRKEILQEIAEIERAEVAASVNVDASIEVGPGLFLPRSVGFYAVTNGHILSLEQSATEVKLDKGRLLTQILVPVPVIPTRHKVHIPGKHSTVRIRSLQPEFYLRTADDRVPEIELVRTKVKGDAREVEAISTFMTGDKVENRDAIPLQRWEVARRVYRFTLGESLQPGEYALVEIIPQEGMNVFVWDFGVDPAPAPLPSDE